MRSLAPRSYSANSNRRWKAAGLLICGLLSVSIVLSSGWLEAGSKSAPGHVALLDEAEYILSSMRKSRYQHVSYVDAADGVYDFDCSGFVDYALEQTSPKALGVITYLPNPFKRPRAQDYYFYFTRLGPGDDGAGWRTVVTPIDLLPGDVIAWLVAANSDSDDTGHVMVVRSNPLIDANRPNEILVEVIDSAGTPHAFDSRATGQTGLGTGTISLATNSTGEAVGFRWRDGESKTVVYTKIAFGQLGPNQTSAQSTGSVSTTSPYSSADTGTQSSRLGGQSIRQNPLPPIAFSILLGSAIVILLRIRKKKRH